MQLLQEGTESTLSINLWNKARLLSPKYNTEYKTTLCSSSCEIYIFKYKENTEKEWMRW